MLHYLEVGFTIAARHPCIQILRHICLSQFFSLPFFEEGHVLVFYIKMHSLSRLLDTFMYVYAKFSIFYLTYHFRIGKFIKN